MGKLTDMGRIFYGAAIAGMGVQTVYDHDLPYMLMASGEFPGSRSFNTGLYFRIGFYFGRGICHF